MLPESRTQWVRDSRLASREHQEKRSRRQEVASCIAFASRGPDVLINNAAVAGPERRTHTQDGHELTFQVNYLAPKSWCGAGDVGQGLVADALLCRKGAVKSWVLAVRGTLGEYARGRAGAMLGTTWQ